MSSKINKIIAPFVWKEIKKQKTKGIHLSLQVYPEGELCIVGELSRDGHFFGIATELGYLPLRENPSKTIKEAIKTVTTLCKNARDCSKKDFNKYVLRKHDPKG